MLGTFDIGDPVILASEFIADTTTIDPTTFLPMVTSVLADPSALKLRVIPAGGATEIQLVYPDVDLIRVSLGYYQGRIVITAAAGGSGLWRVRWESTGAVARGAEESTFIVRRTTFPNPL